MGSISSQLQKLTLQVEGDGEGSTLKSKRTALLLGGVKLDFYVRHLMPAIDASDHALAWSRNRGN